MKYEIFIHYNTKLYGLLFYMLEIIRKGLQKNNRYIAHELSY